MEYDQYDQYDQKIELGVSRPSAIKPPCSLYLKACLEYMGTNSFFGINYWGIYRECLQINVKFALKLVVNYVMKIFIRSLQNVII